MKLRTKAVRVRAIGAGQFSFSILFAGSLALAGLIVCPQETVNYAQAEPASPIERTLTRTVAPGSEIVLSRPTFWNGACEARAFTVTILQQPYEGTILVRDGLNPVVENPQFGRAGRCVGKEIMGKQIVYQSKADFSGNDIVVYEILSDKGEKSKTTVNIEVQ